MSKSWKKILVAGASLLMLASVGTGMSNINVNARHRHIHRVYHHSAWHKGVPAAARGHYASYAYIHGHIRHGERTLINVNPHSATISFRGSADPFGLMNVRTKKLGYGRYMITGHAVEALESSHSSIILTRTRHGAYIRVTNNKLGPKHLINGSYYRCHYNHGFRVLNSEM